MKERILLALLVALTTAAGCRQAQLASTDTAALLPRPEMVSVYELGRQLNLRVAETTPTHVTLKDSANTVLIFTYSGAQVYVNGKPIAPVGKVEKTYDIVYVPHKLVETIRPRLSSAPRAGLLVRLSGVVVIDPGHGGKDPGTTSSRGYYEKDVNLEVARRVAEILRQKGAQVVMTRQSDRFVELEARAAVANQYDADLFVSIHGDSSQDKSMRGFTIYVARSASSRSRRAAREIERAMSGAGLASKGVREADYRVLVRTKGPAVLVEMGYLSNWQDASLLRQAGWQQRIAEAIASGIIEFLS